MSRINVDVVYSLTTQNLGIVAPMPEQIGTLTMHFPNINIENRSQMM